MHCFARVNVHPLDFSELAKCDALIAFTVRMLIYIDCMFYFRYVRVFFQRNKLVKFTEFFKILLYTNNDKIIF